MIRNHKRGYCGGCAALLIGILLLGVGFAALSEAQANKEITELTLAEWLEKKPDAKWLRLKECQVNLLEAVYQVKINKKTKEETIHDVWVPVRPPGSEDKAPLLVKGTEYQDLMVKVRASQDKGQEEQLKVLAELGPRLKEVKTFEGMLATPEYSVEKQLEGKAMQEDFKMLREGGEPLSSVAIGLAFGLGALLSLLGFGLLKRAREKRAKA